MDDSPSQFRRWQAQSTMVRLPTDGSEEADADHDELVRRAAEWVNRTVPNLSVEDPEDEPRRSPPKKKPQAMEIEPRCRPTQKQPQADVSVWDSDEEGVETRTRAEAQPEAGAGGPSSATPYFMQVLGQKWGV